MVGFAGMGTMGAPMAGHLVAAGVPTMVWNRTAEKSAPLAEAGATVAANLEALGAACRTLVLCVGGDDDVREVVETALAGASPTLVIDHSTISPGAARALQTSLHDQGHDFVDAPVTGGSMGARAGTLTMFLGGDEDPCARALELVQPYVRVARRVGGPGAGATMKAVNQIAVGGALLALCESFAFAHRAGLDLAEVRELVGSGAGGSWAMENYGKKILDEDWTPGFATRHQRKDFRYVRDEATRLGASLPGTEVADALLAEVEAAGRGEETTAVLYRLLAGEGL